MSLFSKFIAGGLGFALGGPLGLLIGLMFESTLFGKQEKEVSNNRRRAQATQADFRMSLLVLLAAVMRADNKVVKSELTVTKQFLVQTFGEQSALEGLQILKKLLDQPIDVEPIAVQIGYNLNASSKIQLIHMLYKVADADGAIVPQEAMLIERIAQLMRVPVADFTSVKAMFTTRTNVNWAYDVLEVNADCTDDELKKAYRRMAMKFHPDKVNNMGEDVKRSATEKFRKVNEAYEHIKNQRNIN